MSPNGHDHQRLQHIQSSTRGAKVPGRHVSIDQHRTDTRSRNPRQSISISRKLTWRPPFVLGDTPEPLRLVPAAVNLAKLVTFPR